MEQLLRITFIVIHDINLLIDLELRAIQQRYYTKISV